MRYRRNPFRKAAARRLWGPAPASTLAAVVLAAVVATPPFPPVERFLPSLLIDVGELFWSIPALFAWLLAWRVRDLRDRPLDLGEPTLPHEERATRYFEAAAVPVVLATLILAIGKELGAASSPLLKGGEVVWPGLVSALHGVSRSIVIVAVTAGVWTIQREPGVALRKLMAAGFALLLARLAIGMTVPWMTFGWTWIPRLGHVLGPIQAVAAANLLLNFAVAASAWSTLHARAGAGLEWHKWGQ